MKFALIILVIGTVVEAHSHDSFRKQVPEAPLPKTGTGVQVPLVGSKEPHTANPVVCGVLGGLIMLNWIVSCCCAGGAAAAGAKGSEEGAAAGAGLFGCVEFLGSIAAAGSLVYVL